MLAAVFIFHGGQKGFAWFGGDGWSATLQEWGRSDGLHFPVWLSALVIMTETFSGIALFFGVFTRFFAFAIMGVMAGAIGIVHAPMGVLSCEYPFALLVVALSLVCLGAGRFSLDRAISGQLLPSVG